MTNSWGPLGKKLNTMQEVVVSENKKMAKMLYEMKQDEIRTIEEDKIREVVFVKKIK